MLIGYSFHLNDCSDVGERRRKTKKRNSRRSSSMLLSTTNPNLAAWVLSMANARYPFVKMLHRQASPFSCTAGGDTEVAAAREKRKVVVISGPTGSGKSRLALEVAKRLDGEIISADSVQVYRELDVGAAKPSAADRSSVPHRLLDILHPSQDYSAGKFFDDARNATAAALANGRAPIVAGGTGLYLRWYIYGKPAVPISPAVESSSELSHLKAIGDWEAAVELLAAAGDPTVRSLPANNWYRLRRRLEIIKSSGSPTSAFAIPYDAFRDLDPSDDLLDFEFLCFFTSVPRVNLYRSIDLRCEEMLADKRRGLLAEAAWLLDLGLLPGTNSATRAIGYRQAMEYLLRCRDDRGGGCRSRSPEGFLEFLSEFQKASRNLAKRQMTWFRNERIYRWIDATRPLEEVAEYICRAYKEGGGRVDVPETMKVKEAVAGERRDLKAYRAVNRIFIDGEDCRDLLDWITVTQDTSAVAV